MRKILTSLLIVAILATSVVCCVACQKGETPESPSAFDSLKALSAAGTIEFGSKNSKYGTFLTSVTYDGVTIDNDAANGKYIGVFINTDDEKLIDVYGMCDSITYGEETFNYSGVGIDAIPYTEGLKVLIAFTVDVGNWHYAPVSGSALLFTLPETVEKITLN